jgi:hypothetical protein
MLTGHLLAYLQAEAPARVCLPAATDATGLGLRNDSIHRGGQICAEVAINFRGIGGRESSGIKNAAKASLTRRPPRARSFSR